MKKLFIKFVTCNLNLPASKAEKGFQQSGSLIFDRLIDFHDFTLGFLLFILAIFLWFLFFAVNLYRLYYILYSLYYFEKFNYAFFTAFFITNFQKSHLHNFYLVQQVKNHLLNYIYCNINNHLPFNFNYYFTRNRKTILLEFLTNTKNKVHAPLLEIVWTITPSFISIFIAIPSLYLLYILDAIEPLSFAIKVIGHQWYWTYEIGCLTEMFKIINNVSSVSFDSYMISDDNSTIRLLEVDNVLFAPANIPLTFFITSTDVIHSWAVPSLGIKVDAIPGRLNQICMTIFDVNVFYGQCSELCGVNHGFMPINVVSVVDKI